MEKKKDTYKPDTRKGPATYLIGRDGKVERRRPKHRPWNCAPKTGGNGENAREGYAKKVGEFIENYATVDRSIVKSDVRREIEEGIEEYDDRTMEAFNGDSDMDET